jgi:hypothetical protein
MRRTTGSIEPVRPGLRQLRLGDNSVIAIAAEARDRLEPYAPFSCLMRSTTPVARWKFGAADTNWFASL